MVRPFGLDTADGIINGESLMKYFKCTFYHPIAIISRCKFIICLILICFATGSDAKEKVAPQPPSVETLQPKSKEDIYHLLSQLSDVQLRQIMIQQLEQKLPQAR